MPEQPRTAPSSRPEGAGKQEEERLAQALVGRGLVSADEARTCRGAGSALKLLERLVSAGHLTAGQAARARQEMSQLVGQQIPGYQLLEKLGQGAMGVVYRARQVSLDRLVAVKVLHPKYASSPEVWERLQREAHAAARLSHNNVVQAIDVGSAGSQHYFVMELVEGKTVREELDAGKVYPEREAVEIVLQVAQALAHAHRRGLIHRDVKPANIVLTAEGGAKLADLGLARSTEDEATARSERGWLIGTPFYIAPEQIKGRSDVDGRADLYSLGATLYHMVTGRPPFHQKKVDAVLDAHLTEKVTPPDHVVPDLSAGLGEVVELLLAKDRRKRYRNADDLVIDLECLLADEAPKLACKKIGRSVLEELAEGEEEEVPVREVEVPTGLNWAYAGILFGLLGLSFLLNVILMLRRR
jgi:serine/threonine-protein kinase